MREVGNTPLVEVEGIYVKLECTNPCGSIKDRIAQYIIEESERKGLLKPGTRIVEATSGNTGIAFSYFAKQKGYPITIVMPENMTEERKAIMRELGAELILCSEGNFAEAATIRDRLAVEKNWFNPDQFSNPLNTECHYKNTGGEILSQILKFTQESIGAFVAGVGTGGTLIGAGGRIRESHPGVHIVAVEPEESAVMSGGEPGLHGIGGIGDGFIPQIAQSDDGGLHPMIDEVVCVTTQDAEEASQGLKEKHGFCVGISSGANLVAAKKVAKDRGPVVTVFADSYSRYKSRGLEHCEPGQCPYEHEPVV
ncbi:MAG: PLP-dependent cysteine synthase family protein [Planctomycetota bacterium]|jgi:cysteine synthase A